MHRRIPLALACLALLAPAGHADEVVGFQCGFASTSDPTGQGDPDPTTQYGEMNGGPTAVTGSASPVISVTITCSIQLNSNDPAAPDETSVSATGSGSVAVLPPTAMLYHADPWDWVVACTRVDWLTRDGSFSRYYDAEDSYPGIQCEPIVLSVG